jgi:hypothetical protein
LMVEAVCTSEASVNIYLTTWQYIPEDFKLHTCCHENLKSHLFYMIYRISFSHNSYRNMERDLREERQTDSPEN